MSVESVARLAIFEFIKDAISPVELTWLDSENTSGTGSMVSKTGLRAQVFITTDDDNSNEGYHYEDDKKVYTCEMMMNAICTIYGPGSAEVKRTLRTQVAKKSASLKAQNISLKRFSQSGTAVPIVGSRHEEMAFITLEFAFVDIYEFPRNLVKTIISIGVGDFESAPITITEP